MLFPSFAAILPAFLAFGVVASSAAPLISVAPISVKVNAKAQGSATDIVSSLKTVTVSSLSTLHFSLYPLEADIFILFRILFSPPLPPRPTFLEGFLSLGASISSPN